MPDRPAIVILLTVGADIHYAPINLIPIIILGSCKMNTEDLCIDLTEMKNTKPRKSKRLMMPPKKIVPIKCADKIGVEHWTPERARDLGNFPSPARILLLGPCGVGKSTLIKNLILHARPRFKEVYIIHEDADATKEYDDLEPTDKFNEVPDLNFWNYDGPYIKRAVIVDDLELTSAHKERLKNLAIMFRYASTQGFNDLFRASIIL